MTATYVGKACDNLQFYMTQRILWKKYNQSACSLLGLSVVRLFALYIALSTPLPN
jgi:hypothetical protein